MRGIVYLVQPVELLGTNRYKIGCSKKNDLSRCKNGYKTGTRYIHIMECSEPFNIEKQLISVFNEKFRLIGGREYFEGNETDMITEFFKTVNSYIQSSRSVLQENTHIDTTNNNHNTIEYCQKPHNLDTHILDTCNIDISQNQQAQAASTNPELSSEKCNNHSVLNNALMNDCKICSLSFSTITRFRYHIKTKKHIDNLAKFHEHQHITAINTVQLIHKPPEPVPLSSHIPALNEPKSINSPKIYVCGNCNQTFKHASSKSRHIAACIKNESIEKLLAKNNITLSEYNNILVHANMVVSKRQVSR